MATKLIIIAITAATGCTSTQSSMRRGEYMFYCHSGSEIYQSRDDHYRCKYPRRITTDAERRFEPESF